MTTTPQSALEAADRACGGGLSVQQLTHRRGSAVWRATGPRGSMVIKAGTSAEGREITTREGTVLNLMDREAVSCGPGWFVAPWYDGPSTWDVLEPVREGRALEATAAVHELAQAVADLHARGWIHSDLQAGHAIHTASGVRLLDVAWAWHHDFPQSPIFRGGIVHLLAPELAASVEAGVFPVAPGPAQEVYTLAAVLWHATTGHWPLDYTAARLAPDCTASERRTAIATGRLPLTTPEPWQWPALLKVLRPILLSPPADRPTAAELATELGAL